MRGSQVKRLMKLEKQIGDDQQHLLTGDLQSIYNECPEIAAARDDLEDYVIRHGPEPPRFYQYGEEEHLRRWMWALQIDRRAQALYKRLADMLRREAEARHLEREKEAKDALTKNWEWYLGKPEREAKAAAEREERKRRMEEERLERERRWEEERAARLQQTSAGQQQQPSTYGSANRWLNES
jgi:hypothetical protein